MFPKIITQCYCMNSQHLNLFQLHLDRKDFQSNFLKISEKKESLAHRGKSNSSDLQQLNHCEYLIMMRENSDK